MVYFRALIDVNRFTCPILGDDHSSAGVIAHRERSFPFDRITLSIYNHVEVADVQEKEDESASNKS